MPLKHGWHAILAIPVSYRHNENWRLSIAPGLEFSEPGDPDKALLRIGAGYEFKIGGHFTIAGMAQMAQPLLLVRV